MKFTQAQLEAAIHAANSALQYRQSKSGIWDFYGPRAEGLPTALHHRQAERTLLKEQVLISLEVLGVVEHRDGLWFKIRRAWDSRLHMNKKYLPPLQDLLTKTLEDFT